MTRLIVWLAYATRPGHSSGGMGMRTFGTPIAVDGVYYDDFGEKMGHISQDAEYLL